MVASQFMLTTYFEFWICIYAEEMLCSYIFYMYIYIYV